MRAYRRVALRALLLSTCLLTPVSVLAQDGQAAPESTTLEEVIVTGTIKYRDRTNTTAPELVYTQDFFARFEPVSVGDQLRRVPGVAFTSDIGEADAPQMRGLGQGFTQILVNGRPIPGAGNDRSVFVDRIPAEIVDRIEIVRSPSADTDSQGVGGTINIILKDGASLPPGIVARAGVTYDLDREKTKPNASVSWSGRNADETLLYSVTVDAQKRFNNKEVIQEVFDGDSVDFDAEVAARGDGRSLAKFDDATQSQAVERVEEEDSRDSTDLSLNADLTWRMSDKSKVRFDAFVLNTKRKEHQDTIIYEGDGTVGGLDLTDPEFEFQDSEYKQTNVGVSALFNTEISDVTAFEAQLRYNNFKDDSVDLGFVDTPTDLVEREAVDTDDTEWTADAAFTHNMPGFASSIGIEGVQVKVGVAGKIKDRDYRLVTDEDLDEPDFETIDGRFTYEERRLDAFAQVEWKLSPTLTLQTGVRAENTETEITFQNDIYEGGVLDDTASGAASSDEFMLNPSAHLVWRATPNDQFRFSVAKTVRRPTIDQLIPATIEESPGDDDETTGNPNLEFETSVGFDIGYERRLPGRGILGINFFQRDIKDLIALTSTAANEYTFLNIGKAKVRGVEVDISTPLTFLGLPETGFFANYTHLSSDRADPAGGPEVAIDYQPDYVFNFGVTHNVPSWNTSFGFSYQEQGESRFITVGEIESQKYDGNLEIFIEKRLSDKMVLRLTGTNLLDANSQQAEAGFDGDDGAEILSNQAAFDVDAYEVEREQSSPKITLTLRAVF